MTHRSLWLQEALADEADAPPLEGSVRADVCIVGGGYTGLWTAFRLKELQPALDVVLVEADICGGGASGRNAGFCQSAWVKFLRMKSLFGVDEALRLGRAMDNAVSDIEIFCQQNQIDINFRRDGWLWAATNERQIDTWATCLSELDKHGVNPFIRLDQEELAQRGHSDAHLAGVLDPTGATIQPAMLARGLRRVVLGHGVRIFEKSPMVSLDRTKPPRVRTGRGDVTAEHVVLALNSWSGRVRELSRAIVTVSSDIVATEPMPERLAEIGWTDGISIADSHLMPNYYRTTQDGRLLFGKGGQSLAFGTRIGTAFNERSPHEPRLATLLRGVFPQLSDAAISTSWAGPIDRTFSGLPFFGRLAARHEISYGAGYSGIGICPAFVGGRILASLALDLEDEWSSAGFVCEPARKFPPEPIRYVGGLLVRAAVARKERKEDASEQVGYFTELVARQAPPGYNYQPRGKAVELGAT